MQSPKFENSLLVSAPNSYNVKLKIKKLRPGVKTPTKATDGSAAWDVYTDYEIESAHLSDTSTDGHTAYADLGFSVEIPKGHCLLLIGRSGFGFNQFGGLPNGVGVIDSDYRGEVRMALNAMERFVFNPGDRIGQLLLVPVPEAEWIEVDELSETARGTGGFGSTGK